jgi:NitT/TauT family transport system ATP-binding protein
MTSELRSSASTAAQAEPDGESGEASVKPARSVRPLGGIVCLENVRFAYPNGAPVIDGVSLTVGPGVTAIIGPSGCGKSSLLRLIAGLEVPREGSVRWSAPGPAERHRCAMVFQADTLMPWATVEANVGFYYRLHPRLLSRAEVRAKVASLLELVALSGSADAFPAQLSGGMRRRVSFLAGIAAEPEVLLLDEPFSSVDEPTRVGIHRDVLKLVKQFDMATVIVTHDLAEAVSLADKVIVLSRGPARVVEEIDIDFGPSRDIVELRATDEYQATYSRLWRSLSEQSGLGAAPGPPEGAPGAGQQVRFQ